MSAPTYLQLSLDCLIKPSDILAWSLCPSKKALNAISIRIHVATRDKSFGLLSRQVDTLEGWQVKG